MPENKDTITNYRAQIAELKTHLPKAKGQSKIEALEAKIKAITDVGNGDGTGRKTISQSSYYA